MIKKITAMTMCAMSVGIMVGCANNNNNKPKDNQTAADSQQQQQQTQQAQQEYQEYKDVYVSRTKKFIEESINPKNHNVRIGYTVLGLSGMEEDKTVMEIGMTNKDYYLETKSDEAGHNLIILKGGKSYSVFHDEQLIVEEKSEDFKALNPINVLINMDSIDISGGEIAVGTENEGGKNYEYEEFVVDNKKVRFLFEGDACKAIKVTEEGIEEKIIIDYYDTNVNMNSFELPNGYKKQAVAE